MSGFSKLSPTCRLLQDQQQCFHPVFPFKSKLAVFLLPLSSQELCGPLVYIMGTYPMRQKAHPQVFPE